MKGYPCAVALALASCLPALTSAIWQPAAGTSWNIQLLQPLKAVPTNGLSVWDIDLFDNNKTMISDMHDRSTKVICYFSAGSYEPNRPDSSKFRAADMGETLDGWPDERWLNINSQNVRNIMLDRIKLAKSKGCDGIDPDNMDGYSMINGLGLTPADSINYAKFLANAAHGLNMAIGLKNAGDIIPEVIDLMAWSVNEQCVEYQECSTFAPFVQAGKPVFNIEYPKGNKSNNDAVPTDKANQICNDAHSKGFSHLIKNMNLNAWTQFCK